MMMRKLILLFFTISLFSFNQSWGQDAPPFKYNEKDLITTPSGLKYVIVSKGKGRKPVAGDKVSVNYHGLLTNGDKFDSSYDRGQPIEFPLGTGRVIKGWDEGLAYLPEGSKAVLVIPPDLAYGAADRPGIPANSTLVFHVQLMEVKEGFKGFKYDESKIQKTASGLKYVIVEQGKGPKVNAGDQISVHYHGMLQDGKVFDSSFDRGQPFNLAIGQGQVIKGWDEGLQLFTKGTKAVLFIPANLAYGENGIQGVIPPNATLIFHVHIQE